MLNVTSEVIQKGIVFPEDIEGVEPRLNPLQPLKNRFYPRVGDHLLINPFAVPKKAKKGKKGKKK